LTRVEDEIIIVHLLSQDSCCFILVRRKEWQKKTSSRKPKDQSTLEKLKACIRKETRPVLSAVIRRRRKEIEDANCYASKTDRHTRLHGKNGGRSFAAIFTIAFCVSVLTQRFEENLRKEVSVVGVTERDDTGCAGHVSVTRMDEQCGCCSMSLGSLIRRFCFSWFLKQMDVRRFTC